MESSSGESPLTLHVGSSFFVIEGLDSNEVLVLDRVTQEISLQGKSKALPLDDSTVQSIYGIIGIIRLIAGPYLIVITGRELIGSIQGQDIWKITSTSLHSFKRTTTHLTEKQVQSNRQYISMLQYFLATDGLYFSYSYDLTHSAQRLARSVPHFKQLSLFQRADQRFLWNQHALQDMSVQSELHKYCIPLVHGFVAIERQVVNGRTFQYSIVSRRSPYRAGTRFYMRGVDAQGQVANFVETEQIVELDAHLYSFVQTRGSIPIFWSQLPNLKYKPKFSIANENHLRSFEQHFDSQLVLYGPQVIINLINGTGGEGKLEQTYAEQVRMANKEPIRYIFFDFHHECRRMQWHRLSKLLDQTEELQAHLGYYHTSGGDIMKQQHGVFRTNCIDCLDRTNVVQSLLARRALRTQLQELGVLGTGEKVEDHAQLEKRFRCIWADNADYISKQYAGTGALKTDFTRTGKRTMRGAFQDGLNSAHRYFVNNFVDGYRQDSIDLFIGNYVVEETEDLGTQCPLRQERDWKYYTLPLVLFFSIAMTLLSALLSDDPFQEELLFIVLWAFVTVATFASIIYFGKEFVDKPRLAQRKLKED